MTAKIVLVGCGNMGHAMLTGWLARKRLEPADVAVVEPDERLRARAAAKGVVVFASAEAIPSDFSTEIILFAVKPQVMAQVVPAYRSFAGRGTTFLSIAAGVSLSRIETWLGRRAPVIRCMPNTPAAIGMGMMVIHANSLVDAKVMGFVRELLSVSGKVAEIEDERLMDAVTAVSGSGPAYVFLFIECLTEAAVEAGLPHDTAGMLAIQTIRGAAELAAVGHETPARLREQVTSPNGTTAAALEVLMQDNRLKTLIRQAVEAARRRSVELGRLADQAATP
jgi:pyrroline-5-carboxylate reductase